MAPPRQERPARPAPPPLSPELKAFIAAERWRRWKPPLSRAGLLAAAAVVAWLLLSHPGADSLTIDCAPRGPVNLVRAVLQRSRFWTVEAERADRAMSDAAPAPAENEKVYARLVQAELLMTGADSAGWEDSDLGHWSDSMIRANPELDFARSDPPSPEMIEARVRHFVARQDSARAATLDSVRRCAPVIHQSSGAE